MVLSGIYPVFAFDTRAFELVEKLRLKSGAAFSANGALSLNPGHRPGSCEALASCGLKGRDNFTSQCPNPVPHPDSSTVCVGLIRIADRWPARFAHIQTQPVGLGQAITDRWPADASPHRTSLSPDSLTRFPSHVSRLTFDGFFDSCILYSGGDGRKGPTPPPRSFTLSIFHFHSMIHADSYNLSGSRRGALLIHGFTASPTETRPLGEFLNQQGMTVLGVRLAGHGTDPEDLKQTRWQDWVRSAQEGLAELQGRVDQVFIGGVSMGGVLAAILAADHPGTVAGISLLAPSFFVRNRLFFLIPLIALFRSELHKGKSARAYYEQHGIFSYSVRPTRSLVELRKLMRVGFRRLSEVVVPTQIIMGGKDRLVNPKSGGKILSRIAAEQKELTIAENSKHILTVEPDAPEVFERVWRFFDTLSRR